MDQKKTVESSGEWECLTPKCDVLVKKHRDGTREVKLVCPVDKMDTVMDLQKDIQDPRVRKLFSVAEKPKGGD